MSVVTACPEGHTVHPCKVKLDLQVSINSGPLRPTIITLEGSDLVQVDPKKIPHSKLPTFSF